MQKADFHIHSTYSDGELTPRQILEFLDKKNYICAAITDHDTIDGYKSIVPCLGEFSVKLIAGVEISSIYQDEDIHILAYGFDTRNSELQRLLEFNQNQRVLRVKKFVQKFEKIGINISTSDVKRHSTRLLGRPHIAAALVKKGYASSYKNAFDEFLTKGNKTFVQKVAPSTKDVVKTIKNAQGISVIAHPFRILDSTLLDDVIGFGVDGLETFYAAHSKGNVKKFTQIAEKSGLISTGGTDFHRFLKKNKSNVFGKFALQKSVYQNLIKLSFLDKKSSQ